MIWIYSCQGPLSRTVISYLTEKLSSSSLYLVSDQTELPGFSTTPQGITWLQHHAEEVEFCLFLGLEKATWALDQNDLIQSLFKQVWRQCVQFDIPFLYLSSYETYGGLSAPWNDNELTLSELQPLSLFGKACHSLDLWIMGQSKKPYFWVGLKLAELYQDNTESFMLSNLDSTLPLGELPYIPLISSADAVEILWYLMRSRKTSGIFNITSPDYLMQSSHSNELEIKRMDYSFVMNFQKIRNTYPQLKFKSLTQVSKAKQTMSELTS